MTGDSKREDGSPEPEFPLAESRESKPPLAEVFKQFHTRFWWVTALCLLVAIALSLSALMGSRHKITVRFQQGHGIKEGDALRYRGTDVGRVVGVELGDQLSRVNVSIELDATAEGLAREGSRFWVERPQLSLSRMSGLDTVVGAKYVGVLPGPEDAAPAKVFDGVETPLMIREAAVLEIVIRFRDGHGLGPGDLVKHRGIVVGEVVSLHLDDDLEGVQVSVRLIESASRLARAGSQFWIERPQVSLTEIQGLETLVGGRYIAVLPGSSGGESQRLFEGLDHAPASRDRPEGGLEIILVSGSRSGLERGSPVTYRGIHVGHIASVGLSSDAVKVEARAYIRPEFTELIREDTMFWSTSGIKTRLGWTGMRLDLETLATIAAGGVALATPNTLGKRAKTGDRFTLEDKYEEDWLGWEPQIPLGSSLLPEGSVLARPLRATLRWSESTLGFTSSKQKEGWVLYLEGGKLLGPAELFAAVEDAVPDSTRLEVAGEEFTVSPYTAKRLGPLAAFPLTGDVSKLGRPWPLERVRTPGEPEDCLLVADPQGESVPLSTGRLSVEATGGEPSRAADWSIDASISLDAYWHGASVLSRGDGCLVGVLVVEEGRPRIVPARKKALGTP